MNNQDPAQSADLSPADERVQPGGPLPGAVKRGGAYREAKKAIAEGRATGHALWVLLSDEHQRDGYALKPIPWEGAGEYQHVTFDDGRDGFVRIPGVDPSLPTDWGKRSGTIDEAPARAMNQKATIIAEAFAGEKVKLGAEMGRKGDLQTLQRVVDLPMPSLARIYDAIISTGPR
jgi:hypothetical protein